MLFSASQVVKAIYRATLRRDPDSGGLAHFTNILENDPAALLTLADGFFVSAEHQALFTDQPGIADHSQFGEFAKILAHLTRTGSRHQIVVDVGARGRIRSNSYDLLTLLGWRGVLVEANPELRGSIEREFSGTNFTLVSCAVGLEEGILPFFIGDNEDVSSLLLESTSTWGSVQKVVDVPVRPLASILAEQQVPQDFDVLSLDIEGLDVNVFDDLILNSQYRPRIVVIEASYNFKTRHLRDLDVSDKTQRTYRISDVTPANLILCYESENDRSTEPREGARKEEMPS